MNNATFKQKAVDRIFSNWIYLRMSNIATYIKCFKRNNRQNARNEGLVHLKRTTQVENMHAQHIFILNIHDTCPFNKKLDHFCIKSNF